MTNPAVIGGVGTAIALRGPERRGARAGDDCSTPQVWDPENNQAELEANYFPDRDDTFSSAVTVEGYTTYEPQQLLDCKGPGE